MGLLFKARLHFEKGEYKRARDLFCDALRKYPSCSADVRVGLGLSCQHMGQRKVARMALERALEIDPENTTALIALSVLELEELANAERGLSEALSHDKKAELLSSAMERVQRAYQLDQYNPYALVQLANHLFERRAPVQQVKALTSVALKHHGIENAKRLHAEAVYLRARCAHFSGDIKNAEKLYKKALFIWHDFPLALYARAQINLGTTYPNVDFTKTTTLLRKLAESALCQNDRDTLHLLGSTIESKARAKAKGVQSKKSKGASHRRIRLSLKRG